MGDVYMLNGKILSGLPNHAKDIEFDNTGTTLSSTNAEDAIKEVNSKLSENNLVLADIVSLDPYTSVGNRFVFPCNGYININTASAVGICVVVVYGGDGSGSFAISATGTGNNEANTVYVKKDMSAYIYAKQPGQYASFIPLE